MELPGRDPGVEGGAGAGLRQHGRDEARAGRAHDRPPPGAGARRRASLPEGVLNVVVGRGLGGRASRSSPTRGCARSRSPARCAVGHGVRDRAAGLGKRVQLELGGHNPLIVAGDADLDAAAEAAYAGAFWSAGQKCTATRRIYVQDARVRRASATRLPQRIAAGKVGDPADPETEVGPLVNESQFEEVLAGIARGRAEGGTVLTGGDARATTRRT